ncbi:MAG: A/G-specific adenine glycosylase, partial [Oscillospiraceae bacterium]|nr:A/G-specific adenine glycosylase [Oscillospiraceae bacterium]
MKEHWENLDLLREPLMDWYDAHRRVLPWREEPSPYRTWVSEIMLQQTRVSAVIPYFERFMTELPDVQALAEVPEERLFKLWEGLGYYSRARNLRRAAQAIVSEHGGELPRTMDALRRLPGIGDYTASAIASINFGAAEPAVDGNLLRVAAR